MKLADLANEIGAIDAAGQLAADVVHVTHNSRECQPGSLFVAIVGEKADGHRFIGDAVERGAVAVASELKSPGGIARPPAWIQVGDARGSLARAAAAVYGHPSRRLKLAAVTGTNGKTTTATLIDSIIRHAECVSAMLGTISYRIGDEVITAHHTTPEAADIQRMLALAVDRGCRSAVMEASSHAIMLHRVDALQFAVGVFTNLTRDHLDFHLTMEEYFDAKKRLFDGRLDSTPNIAVINVDDPYGRELAASVKSQIISYGLEAGEITTRESSIRPDGIEFTAATPAGPIEVNSPLVGRFHVYNILAAIGVGLALGFPTDAIQAGINAVSRVPGRFERVPAPAGSPADFAVIVDYAHTDDALRAALQTAREIAGTTGRVITVFGCGGDRDHTKRAPMGEVAGRLSDLVIVTSDNPRSEDPESIIRDAEVGLKSAGRPYLKMPDRREAIFQAVNEARAGDVVMIAGKGHENYQILGDKTIIFDDREVALEALRSIVSESVNKSAK